MNTKSGKWMLFGIMLMLFALVLVLLGLDLVVQGNSLGNTPLSVGNQCAPVVMIVVLAGLASGVLGLLRDD